MINDFAFNGKGILKKGYGTRPAGVRVDGAAPRGFLRFLSLTAFQAEGCGIALTGDEYKVSVTSLPYCIIWHNKHSADWLASLASPYPAAPDFPLFRGQNRFLCFPAET